LLPPITRRCRERKFPIPSSIWKFLERGSIIEKNFPEVPFRWAWSMDPETIEKAVDELIVKEKVKTIVTCDIFPVYSSLEHFNTLYQEIKDAVAERAKVVFTPYRARTGLFAKALN